MINFNKAMVTILVKEDYGVCFDFYTKKLGLVPTWGDKNGPWSSLAIKEGEEHCLAIFASDAQSAYKGYIRPNTTTPSDTITLGIPCDNVDESYNHLKGLGVEFLGEPQTIEDWGMRIVYFRDPEGNLLSLESNL